MSVAKFWIFHSYFIAFFTHTSFQIFFVQKKKKHLKMCFLLHVEVGFEIIIPFRNFRVCRHIESFICSSRNLSFTIAITFYHSILQHNAAFAFQFLKKKVFPRFLSLSHSLSLYLNSLPPFRCLHMCAYLYIISSLKCISFFAAAWKFHVIDFAKLILSDFEFLV